jgi:hypothetical protein
VEIICDTEGRTRGAKATRADIEEKIRALMVPAGLALRENDPRGATALPVLEKALTSLRQNVQPGLVYDHLLLQLSAIKRG